MQRFIINLRQDDDLSKSPTISQSSLPVCFSSPIPAIHQDGVCEDADIWGNVRAARAGSFQHASDGSRAVTGSSVVVEEVRQLTLYLDFS